MDFLLIFAFIGASILLTLMPGPDILYVLTESLTRGRKTGISIGTGLSLGVFVHTILAASGISLLLSQSSLAFDIVKYAGALYLFYLAYQAYHEKPVTVELSSIQEKPAPLQWSLIRKGFLMNVLNPKVSIFFIAFLPQFVSTEGWAPMYQMIVLGLIFMLQAWIIFSLVASTGGLFASWLNQPRFWSIAKWSKIVVLLILGITLLFSANG